MSASNITLILSLNETKEDSESFVTKDYSLELHLSLTDFGGWNEINFLKYFDIGYTDFLSSKSLWFRPQIRASDD